MSDIFIKPARDAAGAPLLVRDPATMQPLAEAGEWKEKSDFWVRRLRDADVIEASPAAPDAPAPAAPVVTAPPDKLITQSA